jgi:hypothetical protein
MPLTGTDAVLSASLRAALLANTATKALDNAALTAFCDVISATVIAHILANAIVVTVGSATTQTGPIT